MSLKESIMNKMMDKQFSGMSSDDKKQMMDKMMDNFFSTMSEDEKKEMMSNMMPKMMEKMMGNNPMMGMMSMMMGKKNSNDSKSSESGKMPWDMCSEMMSGIKETSNTAKFATPELRGLFDDWCQQIEKEMLEFVQSKKGINIEELTENFCLSTESVKYLLSKLAAKNLINFQI